MYDDATTAGPINWKRPVLLLGIVAGLLALATFLLSKK
jgi:hypothetical protein